MSRAKMGTNQEKYGLIQPISMREMQKTQNNRTNIKNNQQLNKYLITNNQYPYKDNYNYYYKNTYDNYHQAPILFLDNSNYSNCMNNYNLNSSSDTFISNTNTNTSTSASECTSTFNGIASCSSLCNSW